MLISKVPDNDGGKGESAEVHDGEGNSHEYQTANELFELMAKNQNFDNSDVDKLTTRDLVLLYKNIDLGTKLMSNANELKRRKPNQHVETVVYNDEPESECSDVSDIYSNEDLHNVFLINKERLDLLNAPSSVENTLCHKLGDLEIHTSDLNTEYDKHFVFKDPYIKEQLKNLKLMNNASESEGAVLPASLLDYICCKRLEDNYNFYMDNIIRYVKYTIEQLKRISNGDYLTDKAKEKWREVENTAEDQTNTKVLATSTSIPLHVERKIGGRQSTWDDIVHSAVDIRSLSKILEKKIVVEVPKLICGSYKLLSTCCADNVIISCKNDKRPIKEAINTESRVDVVFQLKRSETGQVISKISSIMILQTAPIVCADTHGKDIMPLPLAFKEQNNENGSPDRTPRIMELEPIRIDETIPEVSLYSESSSDPVQCPTEDSFVINKDSGRKDYEGSDNEGTTTSFRNSGSYQESSDSSDALRDILDSKLKFARNEVSSNLFPDDLRMTIHKLTMQGAVTEESGEDMSQSTAMKKKSPTRVRIKSPYENQSYIMEEKKRRKLLEIRERRERKKMAITENCKINKHHKYGKGAIMPQSASSVTKLSISNKSFYNSIYGQTTNVDPSKQTKVRNRKGKREVLEIDLEIPDCDQETVASTSEKLSVKNTKKYINRSYYLDDAVTEMMYINMKQNDTEAKELCSASTSVISNDFRNNLNLLSQLIGPSETDLNVPNHEISADSKRQELSAERDEDIDDGSIPSVLLSSKSILNIVPSNSPNVEEHCNTEQKKLASSVECRKSIDQIYDLMKKLGNTQETDTKSPKKYVPSVEKVEENEGRMSSTCQGSDSGTSLKHHLTSSNPSCFSFEKNNTEKQTTSSIRQPGSPSTVVPKVIISSKSSLTPKTDSEKNSKRDRRKSGSQSSPTRKVADNPLKAISQLLHEFENVQKTRHKPNTEQRPSKKVEMLTSDVRSGSRQSSIKRRSRLEQHTDAQTERHARITTPKDKKSKPYNVMDITKIPYQQIPVDDKHADKTPKKKITDILDEAKEARGEAVRGPSKLNSRLNSLAQPKRTYVLAHSEEYQIKYGKTLMADRLQRLAAAPPPSALDRNSGSASSRNKVKRNGSDAVSAVSVKSPPVPPLERAFRTRHSSSSSPEARDRLHHGVGQSYKQIIVPETPQTLMKKMVAVDTYVKTHYGRATSSSVGNEPQSVQKSRVPLLPNDIELASTTSSPPIEESTELGCRLHHIINSIIKTTSQGLEVLTECHESNSKISKEATDDYSLAENVSRSEHVSSDSDYNLDVLGDNNVITSVEKFDSASKRRQKQNNIRETDASQHDLQPIKPVTELEKLENALCRHISVGNFQKRLRIKNLTLTPKQSMQQLFVLQSGDAGSLVVKAPVPHTIKETTADSFPDLTALPVLSKSNLDWNFTGFPMQISTVGYAFPDYNHIQRGSTSLVKLFDEVSRNEERRLLANSTAQQDHPDVQVAQPRISFEDAAQVDVQVTRLIAVETTDTHVVESKNEDTKQNDEVKPKHESNTEPEHAIKDSSETKKEEDTNLSDNQKENQVVDDNKEKGPTLTNSESIEYTTSLDILVGLLNEIQKITTCQTQITNDDKNQKECQQNKELETILNNSAIMNNSMISSPCEIISFTSLDRLRQLESNPSLYSFYLSDTDGFERGSSEFNFPSEIIQVNTTELSRPKPILADKEVEVDFIDRDVVNKFTDVPSQIFPVGMNHSTNVTNSLIGVLSVPSTQSVFSFAEYHSVYSNASTLAPSQIGDVPQIIITRESNQSIAFYEVGNQTNSSPIELPNETNLYNTKIETFAKNRINKKCKVNKGRYRLKTEFDPIMKMKRDILVTVYSILVFTVFAALSFPEMLYRV